MNWKQMMLANVDLIITRHGETYLNSLIYANGSISCQAWEDDQGLKQLNNKGISQAIKLGQYLKSYGWVPEKILTSCSKRTQETARLINKSLGIDRNRIKSCELLAETATQTYLDEHMPDHKYKNLPSYETELANAEIFFKNHIFPEIRNGPVLIIAHEIRNTFLLDFLSGKRTEMSVKDVSFANCGIVAVEFEAYKAISIIK